MSDEEKPISKEGAEMILKGYDFIRERDRQIREAGPEEYIIYTDSKNALKIRARMHEIEKAISAMPLSELIGSKKSESTGLQES